MSRRPALVTQATVARAIRAADKAMPDDTFIYFLGSGPFVKIGHSKRWKERRLQMQVGSPYGIVALLVLTGPVALEKALHKQFRADHYRGEWFHLSPAILAFVKDHLRDCVAASGVVDLRPTKKRIEL